MSCQNVFYETKHLPVNVLTLVDDAFYEFVEQRLGIYQSLLLKIQQINSVPCFLLTNDPCEVLNFNIDDNDLNVLKTKICFPLSDGSFIVKPGVKTGFVCLRDLLSKTTEERLKQTKSTKSLSTTAIPNNTLPTSPSSTQSITTNSLASQTTASSSPDVRLTPIAEHRGYFINLLQAWCVKHKDEFMSDSFDLKEGTDFILNISYNQNNDLQANVKCTCGRSIILAIKDGKLQLSNYQKHLRTTSCSHVKAIKRLNEEHRKDNSQQSSNSLSLSTAMASQSHVPLQQQQSTEQISVPIVHDGSSIMKVSSQNVQVVASEMNSRKRGQSSSQFASSQKAKKKRT